MSKIAESTIRRLSLYLRLLEEFEIAGEDTVSSEALAAKSGATSAQVRKDLSLFGSFGKRGLGYPVRDLSARIRQILGLQRHHSVILVGAGLLGTALVRNRGFTERGFDVVGAYDSSPTRIGRRVNGLVVKSDDDIDTDLASTPVDIAIITTPGEVAQGIVDRLVKLGVRAILNFTATKLVVPDSVAVKDVNMAIELEALSFAIGHQT
jgi:redox-sensing transcriptional repressor